jgi:hypothetical protein
MELGQLCSLTHRGKKAVGEGSDKVGLQDTHRTLHAEDGKEVIPGDTIIFQQNILAIRSVFKAMIKLADFF